MALGENRSRLLCMLALTFSFFIVEVVVSRITSSLSMLSDSFHMLSDVIALGVALVAMRFAEKTRQTDKNTFGWIRADVMGALVNAIFLTALCFTIVLEAIGRFTEPHEIEKPDVILWVGGLGLLVNVIGLILFSGHAGHGHSHGGHGHGSKSKKGKNVQSGKSSASEETNNLTGNQYTTLESTSKSGDDCKQSSEAQMNGNTHCDAMNDRSPPASQMNMRGVYLHVLGDALGSVIVVINALIFKYVWKPCTPGEECVNPCVPDHSNHHHANQTEVPALPSDVQMAGPCWVLYLDPTLCLIMVTILLYTTYPLLKESALILLQTVPKQIQIHRVNERLLKLEGVLAVHDLHIWQLTGSRIIATAHIKIHDPASYMEVAKRIKDLFHDEGIHSTTIQPEFDAVDSRPDDFSRCNLSCQTECTPKLCCVPEDGQNATKKPGAELPTNAPPLRMITEASEEASTDQLSEIVVTREVESSL